jgi:hypothetical protein
MLSQMRGIPLAIVDPDPVSNRNVETTLHSYIKAWWPYPDHMVELLQTEMASLLVEFKGSTLRFDPPGHASILSVATMQGLGHQLMMQRTNCREDSCGDLRGLWWLF